MSAEVKSEAGARFSISGGSGKVARKSDGPTKSGAKPESAKGGEQSLAKKAADLILCLIIAPVAAPFLAVIALMGAKGHVQSSVLFVLLGAAGLALCFFIPEHENVDIVLSAALILMLYGGIQLLFRPDGGKQQFAALSVFAGAAGIVLHFFANLPTGWEFVLPCSVILLSYGGILLRHINQSNEAESAARASHYNLEKTIARERDNMSAERSANSERIAKLESRHNAQLAEAKNAQEQLRAETQEKIENTRAEAQEKVNAHGREANKTIEQLENDISRVTEAKEELNSILRGAQETLAYYSKHAQLDVYVGGDALRECGGIYVIQNIGDGRVKIGMTEKNFAERFSAIQRDCVSAGISRDDVRPVVLVPLDEGKYEVEQKIHRMLVGSKTAGEWFRVAAEEAVATVLAHVHGRRVANFKRRKRMPVGDNDGETDA